MRDQTSIRYIDFHTHNRQPGNDTLAVINLMAGDDVPEDFAANMLFSAGIHPWQLEEVRPAGRAPKAGEGRNVKDGMKPGKERYPEDGMQPVAGQPVTDGAGPGAGQRVEDGAGPGEGQRAKDGPGPQEKRLIEQLKRQLSVTASHPQVVLIGEAGFDRHRGGDTALQYSLFTWQAALAKERDKPMVIHCVKGWEELLRAYREVKPSRPWVIHGFRGNSRLAASLAREGFWFSLGEKGMNHGVLTAVSHERLLLETDNSGMPIAEVYRLFAVAAGYGEEEACSLIRRNFNSLLDFAL